MVCAAVDASRERCAWTPSATSICLERPMHDRWQPFKGEPAMLARDFMTSPTISCHVNDTLNDAAKRMWDADIGALTIVNDDGKLTGIITDRDICMAAYTQGRPLSEILVNSAMATHVVSVSPDTSIGDVEQLMAKYQIRRIPVIDDQGLPVGIVSMNNLAIASVQRDTAMKHGPSKIAHTLASICQPRGYTAPAESGVI
jgi:CBS domain-containing protein